MLWSRAELKDRAKNVLRGCFWSAVVVCLISGLLSGEFGSRGSTFSRDNLESNWNDDEAVNRVEWNWNDDEAVYSNREPSLPQTIIERMGVAVSGFISLGLLPIFIYMGLLIMVIAVIVSLFIGMPIMVGSKRFFMRNQSQQTGIGEILFAYRSGCLGNVVLTMLLKTVKIFLWTLLLIVPGIIKGYEYLMVPYILSENPGIDRKRAFELSAQMMDGQKWEAFVLDLSFFPWLLLGAVTCGVANIFYVNPYMAATSAQLYAVLRAEAIRSGITNTYELPGYYDAGSQT